MHGFGPLPTPSIRSNWYTVVVFTYSQPGPSFINLFALYSHSDLPPLRLLCGEAPPGRDSNPGRADLVAGTLTTIDHRTSPNWYIIL